VHQRFARKADWRDGRKAKTRTPESVALLIDAVRAEITSLPTYGYRRARALVNRTRSLLGLPQMNHKRIYRLMKQHHLLLPKAPKRRASSRPHEGKVAVPEPNTRWCSDGFEIACDNGQVVTGTFTKDL
jgi:putative transposase